MVLSLTFHQTQCHHGTETLDTDLPLALLDPQLHLSQDWGKGHGTLQTKEYNFMQIKTTYFPRRALGNSFSQDASRTPLPLMTEIPPIQSSCNTITFGKNKDDFLKMLFFNG